MSKKRQKKKNSRVREVEIVMTKHEQTKSESGLSEQIVDITLRPKEKAKKPAPKAQNTKKQDIKTPSREQFMRALRNTSADRLGDVLENDTLPERPEKNEQPDKAKKPSRTEKAPDKAKKPADTAKKRPAKTEKTSAAKTESVSAGAGKSVSAKTDKKKKASGKSEQKLPPKKFAVANIAATGAVVLGLVVFQYAFPRSTASEIEKRPLTEFPEFSFESFLSGEYTSQISKYFNDTVPFRDDIKKMSANISALKGVAYNNATVIGNPVKITEEPEEEPVIVTTTETPVTTSGAGTDTPPEQSTTPAPTTTEKPDVTTEKNVNEIADGVITNGQIVAKIDGHYRGISLFSGGKGTTYANAVNSFKEALGDTVSVYSMVVPTSGEYYTPSNFDEYNASQYKSLASIESLLSDDVISVEFAAYDLLKEHKNEEIYTRTDHHWQPLGAYYAAKAFASAAGVPFADISTMEVHTIKDFMGSMYSFTSSADLLNDPEDFVYYVPKNSYDTTYYSTSFGDSFTAPFFLESWGINGYSLFMGGDAKIVKITTDMNNGRRLLVFKDSYGNAEIPFYFNSFEEIYVCDIRYFDLNAIDFIRQNGVTDLLFTMCSFSAVGTNAEKMPELITKQPETTTAPVSGSEEAPQEQTEE